LLKNAMAGANTTAREGLAVTVQYCQPWLRPMEAFTLSVPRELARTVSDGIRMLGYSIHPPFIGAVDRLHPLRLLEQP
jgi:ectoine hydroxylase-related dioxygenase (phytanoyl-CoA dioxygenase family)